jgi:hypothetical protein
VQFLSDPQDKTPRIFLIGVGRNKKRGHLESGKL